LVIPDNVETIDINAFEGCANLTSITWKGRTHTIEDALDKDTGEVTWNLK
jgi:hypothetical protein